MLNRPIIEGLRADSHETSLQWRVCAMALALLDIADLVPGEGDVVERVRRILGENERWRATYDGDHYCNKLRRVEQELDSMRRRWHDLERIQDRQLTFDSVAMELAEAEQERDAARAGEAGACDRVGHLEASKRATEQAYQELRAKLAALADAAEKWRHKLKASFSMTTSSAFAELDAAIAEARKALP